MTLNHKSLRSCALWSLIWHLEKQDLEAMCPNNPDVHAISLNEPMSKNPILGFLTASVDIADPFSIFVMLTTNFFRIEEGAFWQRTPSVWQHPYLFCMGIVKGHL